MDRPLTASAGLRARLRAGLAAGLLASATGLAAGCYLPYPVPAGSVVDRRPAGPAAPDPTWHATDCPPTLGQEVLERVDAIRRDRGLVPLQPHPGLVAAAQAHAEDQAARDRISHTGSDGSAATDRVGRAGYAFAGVGENVAGGYGSPEGVVSAWMDSPGHRAIILSPEPRHAGIGYAFRADGRLHHFWTLVVAVPGGPETGSGCHP